MSDEKTFSLLRILLVEDNVYDQDAFRRALRKGELQSGLLACVRAEKRHLCLINQVPAENN